MLHPAPLTSSRSLLLAFAVGALLSVYLLAARTTARAADGATPPATKSDAGEKIGHLPHVEFNLRKRQVRVECQALAVNAPLEFFCCLAGTSEHEAVVRTQAKPSDIHTALLAIGLKPGEPLTYVEPTKKWLPPHGPPLNISVEFQKDGKTVTYPAYRWIRDLKTKKEPKAFNWVYCGSRVMKDGRFAADDTGYVVTLVNFDYALIDIPQLASSNNDELEWERNAELMPEKGATVWMVIEPIAGAAPTTQGTQGALPPLPGSDATAQAGGSTTNPAGAVVGSDVHVDEAKVRALVNYHEQVMNPRMQAIRQAAQAHYEVIAALRKEQQRLIDEADHVGRTIDELEKQYTDMTTPQPSLNEPTNPTTSQ